MNLDLVSKIAQSTLAAEGRDLTRRVVTVHWADPTVYLEKECGKDWEVESIVRIPARDTGGLMDGYHIGAHWRCILRRLTPLTGNEEGITQKDLIPPHERGFWSRFWDE